MTVAKFVALLGLLAMTGVLIYGFAVGDFSGEVGSVSGWAKDAKNRDKTLTKSLQCGIIGSQFGGPQGKNIRLPTF